MFKVFGVFYLKAMLEIEKLAFLEETARILASEPFRRAKRMTDLLRFLVEQTTAGKSKSLKESVVAVEVFGREPGFDPKLDPVVRNEMRRLRAKLLEYYAGHANGPGLVLEIPKGGYAPRLRKVSVSDGNRSGVRRYTGLVLTAGAFVVMLVLLLAIWNRPSQAAREFNAQPIASDHGVLWHPAISPDGNYVAYGWSATELSNALIYTAKIGQTSRRRLSSASASQLSPAWSPDGREIAFLRRAKGNRAAVVIARVDGSAERQVGQGVAVPNVAGTQLSWSPDGGWLAAALDGAIKLFPVVTGEPRVFRFLDFVPHCPRFSPDGRQIAMVGSMGVLGNAIYRVPVSQEKNLQGEPVRVSPESVNVTGGLAWTADSGGIIFASGVPLESRLSRISIRDAKTEHLQMPGEEILFPDISKGRLVCAKWNRDVDIWRIPLLPGGGTGTPGMLISSARSDTDPQYSPDGERICFVSSRSGHSQIWIANADGSAPVPVTDMRAPLLDCPRWSPDGRSIVFQSMRAGRFQAFHVNLDSRKLRELTNDPKIGRAAPSFSADGAWVYFTTARTGRNEIWKMPVQGGGDTQVTRGGGLRAWESDDGQRLFIEKESPRGLWEKSIASGEEKLILSSHPGDSVFTNAGIWFNTPRGISVLDKRGAEPRPLFVAPTSLLSLRHQMSISPDGRYAVFAQYTENRSELLLVDGFQ